MNKEFGFWYWTLAAIKGWMWGAILFGGFHGGLWILDNILGININTESDTRGGFAALAEVVPYIVFVIGFLIGFGPYAQKYEDQKERKN